jgi:hypothetical protein
MGVEVINCNGKNYDSNNNKNSDNNNDIYQ